MSFSYSNTFNSKDEAFKGLAKDQQLGKFPDVVQEFLFVAISGIDDTKGVSVSVSGHLARPSNLGSSSLSIGVSPVDVAAKA